MKLSYKVKFAFYYAQPRQSLCLHLCYNSNKKFYITCNMPINFSKYLSFKSRLSNEKKN